MSFALLRGAFGLLGRVPWWAWALAAFTFWGAAGHWKAHRLEVKTAQEHAAQRDAILAQQFKAQAQEANWKGRVDEQRKSKDAELARVAAARDAAVASLRDRPDRRPDLSGPAAAACAGATGAELSRPDAVFLVGEASRADNLRAALAECQAWIEITGAKP